MSIKWQLWWMWELSRYSLQKDNFASNIFWLYSTVYCKPFWAKLPTLCTREREREREAADNEINREYKTNNRVTIFDYLQYLPPPLCLEDVWHAGPPSHCWALCTQRARRSPPPAHSPAPCRPPCRSPRCSRPPPPLPRSQGQHRVS